MNAARRSLAALMLVMASCAAPSASPDTAPRPVKQPWVISNEELQDPILRSMDTERAIRYLRPTFFRTTGTQSFSNDAAGSVQVSLDFGPLGSVRQLASFPALALATLYEIRYLDANDAANRFGINANGGPVIVLVSNKQ
jgi:hypothetical protein